MQIHSLDQAKGVMDMRAAIDGLAARYAALRISHGTDPEPLLKIFDAMQNAARANNYGRFLEADLAFHMAIIEMAAIAGLTAVYQKIRKYQIAFQRDTIQEYWPDLNVLFEGHRQIAEAVLDGDPNAAENFAKDHLEAIWYRLAEHSDAHILPGDALDRACAYIAFHYKEPIRLHMLAKRVAGISPGHLARLFRETQGGSFTGYLRDIRMHKAAEMLRNTRLPVRQIAGNTGYLDGSRFAQHFRQRFGVTPLAYRQTHTQ